MVVDEDELGLGGEGWFGRWGALCADLPAEGGCEGLNVVAAGFVVERFDEFGVEGGVGGGEGCGRDGPDDVRVDEKWCDVAGGGCCAVLLCGFGVMAQRGCGGAHLRDRRGGRWR